VSGEPGSYAVTLAVGEETASAPFEFDVRPDSRMSVVMAEVLAGGAPYDHLPDLGTNLFHGLVNGADATLFERCRDTAELPPQADEPGEIVLRIEVPRQLQHYPWECLYDEPRHGFVAMAPRYSVVRGVPDVTSRPRPTPPAGPLAMLVIIPEGSGLRVESEVEGLKSAVEPLQDAVRLQFLRGRVTPDALRARLDAQPWDIVHFIGHGEVDEKGMGNVRLNSPDASRDALWVSGEVFATFFTHHVPRLVVLNSCHGGSQSPRRTLSGIPPFLLRAGVPAVVAMQFEIPDEVAITFARSLYRELLAGRARGSIDLALAEARRAMYQNAGEIHHSFAMPVLYRVADNAVLFAVPERAPAPVAPAAILGAAIAAPLALPQDLLDAFRERRCIPIVSADVLRVGATRSATLPPGPRELAEYLAHEGGYPDRADFDHDELSHAQGMWPLEAVCQHFESRFERFKLLREVQKAYAGMGPPAGAEAIATWDAPGIICTYFDGLIEEAFTAKHRAYRAIRSIDQKISGNDTPETLIVYLRGVLKKMDSLVLTEHDHELLLERMRKMSTDVTELTRREPGRSVLFIGVHPRDPLVRRITLALRGGPESQASTLQGPLFFAYPNAVAVHDPYWSRYRVRWIQMSTEEIVTRLTGVMAGGAGR
jgi:hypothetical protein